MNRPMPDDGRHRSSTGLSPILAWPSIAAMVRIIRPPANIKHGERAIVVAAAVVVFFWVTYSGSSDHQSPTASRDDIGCNADELSLLETLAPMTVSQGFARGCAALVIYATLGCGPHDARSKIAHDSFLATTLSDCLGRDSIVAIGVGRVGALRLDLPLDSLRRQCPNLRDTTANGDEELDTAIVISRPSLRLVGKLGVIESEEGRRPVHLAGTDKVDQWIVIGAGGLLPKNVPITATWRMLVSAYGPVASQGGANGDVFLGFCSLPGITFSMAVPFAALVDTINVAAAESTRVASPIAAVFVATAEQAAPLPGCK